MLSYLKKNQKLIQPNGGNAVEQYFKAITSKKNEVEILITSSQPKIDEIESGVDFDFEKLANISDIIVAQLQV